MKKDFKFGEVMGLLRKTTPFLIFRLLVYLAIGIGTLIVAGLGAALGYGIGNIAGHSQLGLAGGAVLGLGAARGGFVYLVKRYLLYIVKAGHIAVLVELLDDGEIPGGKGQISYAKNKVKGMFGTASLFFGLDMLIKGVLNVFNRMFMSVARFLPIPRNSKRSIINVVNKIFNLSLTFLDEVILSYLMKVSSENPWRDSRSALILYAQNYKSFLKNAVWLALFMWILTILIFLVALAPAALLASIIPGTTGPIALGIALVLAICIEKALVEPFAMTALMQVFYKVTAGQVPNPQWEEKLDNVSDKFRELKERAKQWGQERMERRRDDTSTPPQGSPAGEPPQGQPPQGEPPQGQPPQGQPPQGEPPPA